MSYYRLLDTILGNPTVLLNLPLTTNLYYSGQGSATFTRASAKEFTDFESNHVRTTTSNEAMFNGARRLMNRLATSSTPATQNVTLGIGGYMLQVGGTGTATSAAVGATVTGAGAASAGTPNIFTVTAYGTVSVTVAGMSAGDGFALYNITGESDQTTEREFIQSDVNYGAGVVGVKYYNTAIDGTTPIAATTLDGYDYQPASTNAGTAHNAVGPDLVSSTNIYASYDFTSGWTAVNATINDANTFTASADLGYIRKASIVTIGKRYRLTVAGSISTGTFYVADASTAANILTGFGTVDFTAKSTSAVLLKAGTNGAVVDITTLTLYEIQAANSSGTGITGLGTGAKSTAAANVFPNITVGSADATSYAEIVSDTAAITTAKLLRLQPAGKTYKLVAGAGGALTFDITATHTAATWTHSAYIRGEAVTDTVQLGGSVTGVGAAQALTTAYALKSYTFTAQVGDKMRIQVPAGRTIYVTLFQAEALTVPTSRIITEGAAASRVRDDLILPVADGTNYRAKEGTVTVEWTAGFDSSSIPNGGFAAILSVTAGSENVMYVYKNGANMEIRAYDGTTAKALVIPAFSKGDTITFKSTWSTSRNKLNVYASTAGWGVASAYDGAFTLGSYWYIGYGSAYPFSIKNIRVLGTADPVGVQ